MRMRELAQARPRYGYRRIHVLLRRDGWGVNMKRVRRLSARGAAAAPSCATSQACEPPSGHSAGGQPRARALEHGFCPRCALQR